MKVITFEDIAALGIKPEECYKWAETMIMNKNQSLLPPKISIKPKDGVFCNVMPSMIPFESMVTAGGIKVVTRYPDREPSLESQLLLLDAEKGDFLALMDATWITTMRTGAVAALAARTFQKQGTNTYSMLGLGNIARAVALCLIADNSDREITIKLLRYKDQAEQFIDRFKAFNNVTFDIIDDKDAFASEAEVLISCVTVAKELLFPDDSLFKKGVTVIPVHMRGFQNCDLFFDKVYGDETSQIKNFKYFDKFRQYDELHHVLQGKNPGRTNNDERILCYNYGIALHDIVFASRIFEKTKSTQIGFDYKKESNKVWV